VDVTPEELDKAFVEWVNAKSDLPMDKKELFDYMDKMKAERAKEGLSRSKEEAIN